MAKKFTLADVLERLPPYLKLEVESFTSINAPAVFVDEVYGRYEAKPGNVLRGHGTHKLRARERVKQTNLERLGVEYPTQSKSVREKVKQTNLEKLGVEYPTQSQCVREKVKQTNLERYGVEHTGQSEEVKAKIEKSNLERYGVKHAFQNEGVRVKADKTKMDRYGTTNTSSLGWVADKTKKTNLERRGVEYPTQDAQVREKVKASVLEKYGVENTFQSEFIKSKIKKTNLDRLGVEYPMQSPVVRGKVQTASRGELELKAFVESLNHTTKKWYLGGTPSYELDIYIPDLNIAIEYNGDYWHSEAQRPNNYHYLKSTAARLKGIHLIHIFESEWLAQRAKIEDFLLSRLGRHAHRFFARKLALKTVPRKDCLDFFDRNHLQGKPAQVVDCYGLYNDDDLIMAAAFSKPHRQNMKSELHLSRLASKMGCQVVGGISRLCKHALKIHGPFVSYVHDRLSTGDAYRRAGFVEVGKVKPDYWYYDTYRKVTLSKQSRKKRNVGTPEGMTEHEHALKDGLVRIYDCGKTKFRFG